MSEEDAMDTGNGNGHTAIWARLASVEAEYRRLGQERDQALLERDKARAALVPLLEQVEALRDTILAQLPKKDARLPSTRGYVVTPEMVDRWVEQYKSGMSLTRMAQSNKVRSETIKTHLAARGIKATGKRRYGHGQRKETCPGCGAELEPGEEGMCEACQAVERVVAEHRMAVDRMARAAAEADPTGTLVVASKSS